MKVLLFSTFSSLFKKSLLQLFFNNTFLSLEQYKISLDRQIMILFNMISFQDLHAENEHIFKRRKVVFFRAIVVNPLEYFANTNVRAL